MTELIVTIPPQKEALIKELIEQLGGSVKRPATRKPLSKKQKEEEVDHTYLFGKWKDDNIDAGKIRKEIWRKI